MGRSQNVTGVTRRAKAELLQDWQSAFGKVRWASWVLGLLSGLGVLFLMARIVCQRTSRSGEKGKTWHLQTPMDQVPTSRI